MIYWNPTAGVGLRHAMGAKYESCSMIGNRIRRNACGADLDASLQGDDLDGPGAAAAPEPNNRRLPLPVRLLSADAAQATPATPARGPEHFQGYSGRSRGRMLDLRVENQR
jgi:hypothetical protein